MDDTTKRNGRDKEVGVSLAFWALAKHSLAFLPCLSLGSGWVGVSFLFYMLEPAGEGGQSGNGDKEGRDGHGRSLEEGRQE